MRLGRWETIRKLGEGGQGNVYLAIDTGKIEPEEFLDSIRLLVGALAASGTIERNRQNALSLLQQIETYLLRESGECCGALKVIHEAARKEPKALERFRREVEALTSLNRAHLIRIVDASADEGWFVTPYYRDGTLARHLGDFAGKPVDALRAFVPLVDGVAALHRAGLVHRDIKPENIFLSDAGLVLGDFGIVYFEDGLRTRVSDRYENVGSRDWMPGWAMGMRVDEIRPSFDVFCLGKVLWAMVSGRTKMRLWYFKDKEFDLEVQFPSDERMLWINRLLAGCVVEREEYLGWQTAEGLLENAGEVLTILRRSGQVMHREVRRWCRVCGHGSYRLLLDEGSPPDALRNFGLNPAGERFRIFTCDKCGHVQIFRMNANPLAWGEVR